MTRHICYITGTRADFGLMRSTLLAINDADLLHLSVIATGTHLDERYGNTVSEIEATGLCVAARVPIPTTPTTGATMARNIGRMVMAFVDVLEEMRPDIVLLLGDRGEMLAGALAAGHLNIPVAHIHGGERSGTIDESVRHAISKLAHLHFTATPEARERLIKMGEEAANVHVTGAPGLDGLLSVDLPTREQVMAKYELDPDHPFALLIYHPVLQQSDVAETEISFILDALTASGYATVALMPNSDAGSDAVRATLLGRKGQSDLNVLAHLERNAFIAAMATADVMIGNSSAGIIEAASFGTPVLNIGTRQNLRERNANVRDIPPSREAIETGLREALMAGRFKPANIFGDGHAAERIVRLLASVELPPALLMKVNCY